MKPPSFGAQPGSFRLAVWLLLFAVTRVIGADSPPNVILILADDFALGDLASLNGGRSRTPNIDRLIRDGVWFNTAYSASAVCAPARAALLTGRYPHRTGVVTLEMNTELEMTRLKRDEITIADVFASNGYVTGLIGKWHTGSGAEFHPMKRGFAEFEGFFGSDTMTYDRYLFDVQGEKREVNGQYLTDNLSERAVAFVRRHHRKPFFLHLAHYAPHRPLGAPAAVVARYLASGLNEKTAMIYAMIEIMDRGIGELMAELERLGIRKNTLVIFTSDNGPDPIPGPRFNLNLRGTKYEISEGGIRVPLVFNWPERIGSGVRDTVAHFTDLFPTLIDLARLKPPARTNRLDGVSLQPVLFGAEAATNPVRFWQWNRSTPNYTHNAAMRAGPWKLVRPFVSRSAPAKNSPAVPVLYNLATDPLESTDVAQQHPTRYKEMIAALDAWCAEMERDRTRP